MAALGSTGRSGTSRGRKDCARVAMIRRASVMANSAPMLVRAAAEGHSGQFGQLCLGVGFEAFRLEGLGFRELAGVVVGHVESQDK